MRRRGTGIGKTPDNIKWTEKKLNVREMGTESSLNKEGFWKKPESLEIKVGKDGQFEIKVGKESGK